MQNASPISSTSVQPYIPTTTKTEINSAADKKDLVVKEVLSRVDEGLNVGKQAMEFVGRTLSQFASLSGTTEVDATSKGETLRTGLAVVQNISKFLDELETYANNRLGTSNEAASSAVKNLFAQIRNRVELVVQLHGSALSHAVQPSEQDYATYLSDGKVGAAIKHAANLLRSALDGTVLGDSYGPWSPTAPSVQPDPVPTPNDGQALWDSIKDLGPIALFAALGSMISSAYQNQLENVAQIMAFNSGNMDELNGFNRELLDLINKAKEGDPVHLTQPQIKAIEDYLSHNNKNMPGEDMNVFTWFQSHLKTDETGTYLENADANELATYFQNQSSSVSTTNSQLQFQVQSIQTNMTQGASMWSQIMTGFASLLQTLVHNTGS